MFAAEISDFGKSPILLDKILPVLPSGNQTWPCKISGGLVRWANHPEMGHFPIATSDSRMTNPFFAAEKRGPVHSPEVHGHHRVSGAKDLDGEPLVCRRVTIKLGIELEPGKNLKSY